MRYSCFSLVKSNSTLSVLASLLMSSSALWLPPRWWPNRANVTASNTDDFPLPLVPESIHSGDPSNRISCSSLYDRKPDIFTRCGIILDGLEKQDGHKKDQEAQKKA